MFQFAARKSCNGKVRSNSQRNLSIFTESLRDRPVKHLHFAIELSWRNFRMRSIITVDIRNVGSND